MIEATVIDFLSKQAGQVEAFPDVPKNRPEVFITVERTGGESDRFMDYPQLAVQVWALSREKASMLAFDLRQACSKLALLPQVAKVDLGGLYNFPDPDSKHARYQFTLDMTVMN